MKLNILSCIILPIALVTLSTPAPAQAPDTNVTMMIRDSLYVVSNGHESFILTSDSTDFFPSFFLVDTTLSTLVVNDELSIQVELRRVFFLNGNRPYKRKGHIQPMPAKEMAMMPRRKTIVIPSTISLVKITL